MRFILKITIFIFITIIFSFTSLSANDQNNNISFRAHEAIYDLNIGKITNSSKIHNAVGQMHLTVKEVCDGWVVNQNTTVDITDKMALRLEIYIDILLGSQKRMIYLGFYQK